MVVLFLLLLALSQIMTHSIPGLVITPDRYDCGIVSNGCVAMAEFKIQNTGESSLETQRVRACCGASAQISNRLIAPGTNVTLRVFVEPRGNVGEFRKTVNLLLAGYPSDPISLVVTGEFVKKNSTVQVSKAVVPDGLSITPDKLVFSTDVKNPLTRYIRIESLDKSSHQWTNISLQLPNDAWHYSLETFDTGCIIALDLRDVKKDSKNTVLLIDLHTENDNVQIVLPIIFITRSL